MAKLTEKQKRFCEEYLIDLNATQAALRAGYSQKTAYRIGAELLQKTSVSTYLSELRKKQSERTQITADKVLREIATIAFSDRTELAHVVHRQAYNPETGQQEQYADVDLVDTEKLSDTAKKTISGIKHGKNGIEVSSYDKLKALELLGKHLGVFEPKPDITSVAESDSDPLSESLKKLAEEIENDK